MNTMGFFVWVLPVLFLVHEFEEIFMIEAWYERRKEKISKIWPQKKPFGLDHAGPFLSASISIGIFSEFIVVVLICLLCVIFENYYAWYGLFAGFLLHLPVLHGMVTSKFKGYSPGVVTGAIVLVPFIWVLYRAAILLDYGILEVVLSTVIVQFLMTVLVFRGLHKLMTPWSARLVQYASGAAVGQPEEQPAKPS